MNIISKHMGSAKYYCNNRICTQCHIARGTIFRSRAYKDYDFTNSIFLAQTDTTIGFLSNNVVYINQKKNAQKTKPLLQEFAYFRDLTIRIPPTFRRYIRKAKKTSFILSDNMSFRVIHDTLHQRFLQNIGNLYSSSANPTGKGFNDIFAYQKCDIIVVDKRGLFESKSSTIFKIKFNRIKRIRP